MQKQIKTLLEKVGRYQREHQKDGLGFEEKNKAEFVTQIDRDSEEMIKQGLSKILPEAGFYGEELGRSGNQSLRWIVDPIDGTTNYLSGLDYYAISIALYDRDQGLFGMVYQPANRRSWALDNDLFFVNDVVVEIAALEKTRQLQLSQSLVSTGFPYRSQSLRKPFSKAVDYCLDRSRGIRRFGSAALDLCHMATGSYGGFFESDLQPYDIAASLLFIKKAGARIGSESGASYDMEKNKLLITCYDDNSFLKDIAEIYRPFLS